MKKVIIFILFAALFVFRFSYLVSADEINNSALYFTTVALYLEKFFEGELTPSEYRDSLIGISDTFANSEEYSSNPAKWGSVVGNVGRVADEIMRFPNGPAVADYLADVLHPYKYEYGSPSVDMQDRGALVIWYHPNWQASFYYYCDYAYFHEVSGEMYLSVTGNVHSIYYYDDGRVKDRGIVSSTGYDVDSTSPVLVAYYGDVRDPYGNPVTDPNANVGTISKIDFSKKKNPKYNPDDPDSDEPEFVPTTPQDIEDLIDDIIDVLYDDNPDILTIEEALEKIYKRLGKIDSDDDGAKLDIINSSILELMRSNNENNAALVEILLEMRDYLKDGMGDSEEEEEEEENECDHVISGTLYNVKPLEKSFLNNLVTDKTELKVQYEGRTYYLESCGCLKLGDKYYHVDMNYDNYVVDYDFSNDDVDFDFKLSDGSSAFDADFGSLYASDNGVSTFSFFSPTPVIDLLYGSQRKKIDKIVDMVRSTVNLGVPYDLIQSSTSSLEGIIFNNYAPQDITFIVFDTEFTLLRASDFSTSSSIVHVSSSNRVHGGGGADIPVNSESSSSSDGNDFSSALVIVRQLSSLCISVVWVLSMRKKIVSLI